MGTSLESCLPRTGGWYIENSLTTLGKKDPVSDLNRELWNAGAEGSPQRDQARKQKRKLNYYSNIYVVKDSANPSNEGRVFLYRYGKKIFDKIMESMQPAFEDETPVNPFDFWKGADFKVEDHRVAGFWNYDKSEFAETICIRWIQRQRIGSNLERRAQSSSIYC